MALSVIRWGIPSLRGLSGRFLSAPTPVLCPQVATIVSKTLRDKDYTRPKPYPYKTSNYGFLQAVFDKTTHRFDENSKIIVVDGPIAAGKTAFAKEIADELDMLYVPEANMDMYYINSYGYDLRQLDDRLPESTKSFDEKNFHQDPTHLNVAGFQFQMFRIRLKQYINALAHVLSTGQGVVMDRSVYSDFVFVEAMTKFGFLSKAAQGLYYECKKLTVPELLRPHLVIYLDVPVDIVLKRIKERNLPHEVNSKVYSPEFLSSMENVYKSRFLKEMSVHSELLLYDWSEKGEPEIVVEDIERIKFDFEKNDPKMADWRKEDEWEWCETRIMYTKLKNVIMQWMNVPPINVPELFVEAQDVKIFNEVVYSAPGMRYAKGFNEDMGDQFIATKVRVEI